MTLRLNFIVEGQTEEVFVNHVLRPHLAQFDKMASARCVYTAKTEAGWYRGGVTKYGKIRKDISIWAKQDANADARFTSMLDLYRLPRDFPGFAVAMAAPDARARATILEGSFAGDISDWRFVPYIQVHEFEALIFADASKLLETYPEHGNGVTGLVALANAVSPELIDDNDPPSKRIESQIPAYNKTAAASQVATAIGIQTLRSRCPHFESWLIKLENL